MKTTPSLSRMLRRKRFPVLPKNKAFNRLQLEILRIQQSIWHQKKRVIIVLEGFDAAGKGGTIRRLVENLDPRGFQVHSVGPPKEIDQRRHYLFRFWEDLPRPGCIAIFDRSWYGRVLVEKVEKITPKDRCKDAYREIAEFETMLLNDGVEVIKFFLAIDKAEQLKRFEERLHDPYKQWKLTKADVEARSKWDAYVKAVDKMFKRTHTPSSPWHLVAANDKHHARHQVLSIIAKKLKHLGHWMESKAQTEELQSLKTALEKLGVKDF